MFLLHHYWAIVWVFLIFVSSIQSCSVLSFEIRFLYWFFPIPFGCERYDFRFEFFFHSSICDLFDLVLLMPRSRCEKLGGRQPTGSSCCTALNLRLQIQFQKKYFIPQIPFFSRIHFLTLPHIFTKADFFTGPHIFTGWPHC